MHTSRKECTCTVYICTMWQNCSYTTQMQPTESQRCSAKTFSQNFTVRFFGESPHLWCRALSRPGQSVALAARGAWWSPAWEEQKSKHTFTTTIHYSVTTLVFRVPLSKCCATLMDIQDELEFRLLHDKSRPRLQDATSTTLTTKEHYVKIQRCITLNMNHQEGLR